MKDQTDEKQNAEEKRKTFIKIMLLMGVGFVIDVGQALIIYNAGKGAEAKSLGSTYKWKFPAGRELLQTAGLVLVTSILTGLLVGAAESAILGNGSKEKKPA